MYLDRQGLGSVPSDVDVRHYRGRDGESLLVVDNWYQRRGLSVELDGRPVSLSDERLAIIVVPKPG